MNNEKLLKAIGDIDGKYVKEAMPRRKERPNVAPHRFAARKLIPLAAALAVLVVVGIVAAQVDIPKPPGPVDLPSIPWNGLYSGEGGMGGGEGGMGGGMDFVWSANAAELHRDSPAFGREDELQTMSVYRNPNYPLYSSEALGKLLSEANAMEIAAKFSRAMGKTYTYAQPGNAWQDAPPEPTRQAPRTTMVPPDAEGQEQTQPQPQDPLQQEKLDILNRETKEINDIYDRYWQVWEFRCGGETLTVSALGTVSLRIPLSEVPRTGAAARHEAICRQAYEPRADAIEALTGLRYNKASTALIGYFTGEDNYGEKDFKTFFYVNNPGDTLARQAEDYALNRLHAYLYADAEEPVVSLSFTLRSLSAEELLGNYPVMDLESAKRELMAGRCETIYEVTNEMLARATIEDVELVY
ncbi:MAG: hypothetical protein LBB75_00725, partial [Oscillospiraceae bacterium]|nr:hypothetical protein [Oscillospiraceae bacterium]